MEEQNQDWCGQQLETEGNFEIVDKESKEIFSDKKI